MPPKLTSKEYVNGILANNVQLLSQAITITESKNPLHRKLALEMLENCYPHSGNSIRIAITGVPGVGKSTFIDALGMHCIAQGRKVAVLAIDPTSEKNQGSILGDKTRMDKLSAQANAFIRPSPSSGSLGGVASATREAMILCEAAGYDTILIETVGVGQSETLVNSMTDFFLLLMLAGAGDELQGIKRGITELADAILINKADKNNQLNAQNAVKEYQNALHLFPARKSGWVPKVNQCSGLSGDGIEEAWKLIMNFQQQMNTVGFIQQKRAEQTSSWIQSSVEEKIKSDFYENPAVVEFLSQQEKSLNTGELSPFIAMEMLFQLHKKS